MTAMSTFQMLLNIYNVVDLFTKQIALFQDQLDLIVISDQGPTGLSIQLRLICHRLAEWNQMRGNVCFSHILLCPGVKSGDLKVYMTDFFLLARLYLPNVLISVAKNFFDSDFPSLCFDVPKASNFTSGGVQNRDTKQETGNDCDVNSGPQASRKTDFSVIFLL